MKDLGKILCYFVAVIVLGALLAPPLFWAGRGLAANGILTFLAETDFQKFFNRGMLIAAFALLWPMIRWLQIPGVRELGIDPDRHRFPRFGAGFLIGGLCVALLAGGYIAAEVYRWRKGFPWEVVPRLLLSAIVVGILEEVLFRGGILGLFRRTMRPWPAIIASSALFSAVHFLKPDKSVKIAEVNWLSGFELVPHVFHQFAEPLLLLGQFTTIFVLGVLLADATVRTRSLWMAIGLHAGVVFVKMTFSKFTKRKWTELPWIGEELQIGLIPVAALLLAWALVRLHLRYVDSSRPA